MADATLSRFDAALTPLRCCLSAIRAQALRYALMPVIIADAAAAA